MNNKSSNSIYNSLYTTASKNPSLFRFIIYFISLLIRLLLIAYSMYHNIKFDLKYSDVDYLVYSDSTKYILSGQSPYLRHTYRYTPILSFLMVFNELWFHDFGKILFTISDLLVGYIIEKCLWSYPKIDRIILASIWLLNPFSIGISSRGNADTLICLLVLLSLWLIMKRWILLSSILFGISVHFKIYPVIYTLPFILYIYNEGAVQKFKLALSNKIKFIFKIPFLLLSNINRNHIKFGFFSFLTFSVLTYLTYYYYGFNSIYETYLHQYIRKDHRHNFSLYFNTMYYIVDTHTNMNSILSFVPQLLCVFIFSIVSFDDLPLSLFLMTVSFVALNKVMTSQYFLWWMALLPLVIKNLGSNIKYYKNFLLSMVSLLIFKFLWLFWGYRLEFLGYNSFNEMLFSSSFLVISHMLVLWTLIYESYTNKIVST
ncbi:mannosyltransferase [Theileria orientalis strain Shintoku]|uniref:GPI mannosyltransferase 1 n=1 Tax=Theileria orientalis strain Shintoku TaxID=869250 RepID=J4DQ86_THEOR|nr:mannosyltransferase [Theileria orientalis strain Shintoku]BAM42019.1 mannosyltransferase [Theileria orientalis strain Shintoku]|eukprot:XP_009692320.1 mannosyltransferase [Theileria orientalis strain Shintoku]